MSKKRRPALFAIFFGVFLLSYTIGNAYKMSADEAQNFLKEFQGATAGIDALGIFTHNLSDTLPMFVPGFGIGWGSYTAWSTGAAFEALISQNPMLSKIPPIAIFLVSPFGMLELVAYSLAMSQSFVLLVSLIKRGPIKQELRPTIIEIGIVVGLLLAAAFIEFQMIHLGTTK